MEEFDFLHDALLVEGSSDNCPSGIAFDWRTTEKTKIDGFFSLPKKKVEFAKAYNEYASSYPTPTWIEEVCNFLEAV